MEDCTEVSEVTNKELIWIEATIANKGGEALRFDVERFLLGWRSGDVIDPVDVRADFEFAPFLFPLTGLITAGAERHAYVTFDGRFGDTAGGARSLSYAIRRETIDDSIWRTTYGTD